MDDTDDDLLEVPIEDTVLAVVYRYGRGHESDSIDVERLPVGEYAGELCIALAMTAMTFEQLRNLMSYLHPTYRKLSTAHHRHGSSSPQVSEWSRRLKHEIAEWERHKHHGKTDPPR